MTGASASSCSRCHEFGFPVRDHSAVMVKLTDTARQQDTVGEWERWRAATGDSRTCASCHMRGGDHSFGGVRRFAELARVLRVRFDGRANALVISTTSDVGHSVPTGDVMRWLSVEIASGPLFEDAHEVARFGRKLGWTADDGEPFGHLTVLADSRIAPGESRVVALPPSRSVRPSPDGKGSPRYFRLVYHLISPDQEREELLPPDVSRIVVLEGSLEEVESP